MSIVFILMALLPAVNNDVAAIKAHKNYKTLNDTELKTIENIIDVASRSKNKDYYFKKLQLLLDTETNSVVNIREKSQEEIDDAFILSMIERNMALSKNNITEKEYVSIEEEFEKSIVGYWTLVKPEHISPYYYIYYYDGPLEVFVHINVRLIGDKNDVSSILIFEDAIEKHLSMNGFMVNLEFVDYSADDVFDVTVDMERWTTSRNWASGHYALAHEVMHLLGEDDEYDWIDAHADNENMSRENRLYWFYKQMMKDPRLMCKCGIMSVHKNKPLQRHVCDIIYFHKDCLNIRNKVYGKLCDCG